MFVLFILKSDHLCSSLFISLDVLKLKSMSFKTFGFLSMLTASETSFVYCCFGWHRVNFLPSS